MFRVEFRAEQSRFFGCGGHEQDRPFGRRIQFCERGRELNNRRHARRVIDRAIENLIALQFGMTSEMIPVRRVNDVFVAQFLIAAFEFADDIVRFE